jgi:hypothetical protein
MLAAVALTLAVVAPCPPQDAGEIVARGPQSVTGRVAAVAGARFTLVVEQARPGLGFGKEIEVLRAGLAQVRVGDLIGLALRPDGERWVAGRCDLIPSARLSKAIQGRDPCPAPRVRSVSVRVRERTVRTRLAFSGDVAAVTIAWDGVVRQRLRVENPGIAGVTRDDRLRPGRHRLRVTLSGGSGPGCGERRERSATARRTVLVG